MGLTMSSFCATFINFPQSDIRRIFYPLCTFPSPLKQQPRVSAAENPPFPLPFLPRTIKNSEQKYRHSLLLPPRRSARAPQRRRFLRPPRHFPQKNAPAQTGAFLMKTNLYKPKPECTIFFSAARQARARARPTPPQPPRAPERRSAQACRSRRSSRKTIRPAKGCPRRRRPPNSQTCQSRE